MCNGNSGSWSDRSSYSVALSGTLPGPCQRPLGRSAIMFMSSFDILSIFSDIFAPVHALPLPPTEQHSWAGLTFFSFARKKGGNRDPGFPLFPTMQGRKDTVQCRECILTHLSNGSAALALPQLTIAHSNPLSNFNTLVRRQSTLYIHKCSCIDK